MVSQKYLFVKCFIQTHISIFVKNVKHPSLVITMKMFYMCVGIQLFTTFGKTNLIEDKIRTTYARQTI